jgi:hypothetical protein
MYNMRILIFSILVLALTGNTAVAQDDTSASSGWKHSAIIYLLAPTIEGTVGVGPIDGDMKVDPGTVFDTLDGAFLGGWVSEKGDWGVFLDLVYMNLSEDFKLVNEQVPGEIGNKQLVAGVNGLYRLSDSVQFMAGVMYADISMKLSLDGPLGPRNVKAGESWADPMVGLRFATPVGERWSFAGFGQVGGFGVGSDLTWQLSGSFSYRMTQRSSLLIGYRYLDFDYESGKGRDLFKFDMAEHGPALGFRFNF